MTPQPTPYNPAAAAAAAANAAHAAQYSHQVRPGGGGMIHPGYENGAPPPYTAGGPYPLHMQRTAHPHPNQPLPSQAYSAQVTHSSAHVSNQQWVFIISYCGWLLI